MTAVVPVNGLRGLHQDLVALTQSQLLYIDSLTVELQAHVESFRKLLDKPPKNDASRRKLQSEGTVDFEGSPFAINDLFKEGAIQLADTLNLDEIQAAYLLLDAQRTEDGSNDQYIVSAIVHFHQNRHYLLECFRLILRFALDEDSPDEERNILRALILQILETKDGPARNASIYTRKCFSSMEDIESWLQSLTERAQGALALGQPLSSWYEEASRFQQTSLLQQHESLAAIVTLLIKSDYTSVEDFHKLLDKLPRRERWNHLTVHYIPAIIAFSSQYGCPEGSTTLRESRALNTRILDLSGTASWILGTLQAVTVVFWLAEHNSWYIEVPSGSPVQGANLQDEARIRSQAFSKALADGAFQCILSICSSLRPSQWYNPTRAGLIDFLLRDAPFLGLETNATSSYFQELYMEQIEIFTNALVTNMPDTLRRFKSEEDDQRRLLLSGQQGNRDGKISEQDLHLERFMVIISLAYQDRSESATLFWDDPDGNLYGFVQWASKRLSTPQVASFCLMLSSIAEGKQCASSAHKFLQEESKTSLSRQHRSSSLTWFTIFEELQTYTNKVRDHSTDIRTGNLTISVTGLAEISEPESVLMLECYLRLAATITRESLEAAQWIMRYPAFHVVDNLLSLCSPGVPGRLQAYAFSLLQALSIGTDSESAMAFWACIDQWASGALGSPTATAGRNPITPDQASHIEVVAFSAIAADAELASEFTALLQSLILLRDETGALCDRLPFPEQLGSTYRMPGIDPYVDLVFGKLLLSTVPRTDDILQRRILQYHILNFGVTCLGSFNENLIILANQSPIDIDSTISTSSLQDYITLHPLGKVMDWMFNDAVLREIFATSRQDIDEVASAAPDSPLILLLLRCLDIMNLVMELQSTYLEILRPRLSAKSVDQRVPVFSTSLASFQDAVANNLGLIVDLAKYSGVGIQNLATSALTLLGKLASSRRLNNQFASLVSQSLRRNRLIEVLQQNDEMEPIQHYLTSAMEVTDRELEHGPDSSRYLVKISILDFLNNCLDGLSSTPSLAHALLGYTCHGSTIFVDEDSEFSRGVALFHAVVSVILSYPDGQDLDISGWTQILKRKAIQVLRTLWQSPMTSSITLTELQAYEVLPQLLFGQTLIDINTQWAGRGVEDEDFIFTESAIALTGYLYQRGALLDLASEELRLSKVDDAAISASKIISILVGLKPVAQESTRVHNLLLDLLDFISLDPFLEVPAPPSSFFASLNTEVFVGQSFAGSNEDRSTKLLEDLISLRLNQLHTGGQLASQMDLENAETEASLLFLNARGRTSLQAIEDLRLKVLQAWINALMLVITDSECEEADKFYLRERTVSKLDHQLERFAKDVKPEAVEIAKLMHFLLSEHIKATRGNGFASVGIGGMNEKLYVLYQTSVRSIYVPDGSAELRQVLYDICRTYLNSSVVINGGADLRKQIQRVIWLAGKSLLDHLCDDALGELGARRISALLTLKSFEDFSHTVDFDYVSKTLSEANFIVVLVESIQDLPLELKETASEDVPALLASYESQLSLLTSIAQTRHGANYVADAGLFQAIQASRLFSVDPDLGIAMDNADALEKFHILLLALTRLTTSVILSRGPQNQQSIAQARTFLAENRSSVVAMFKRSAKIGQGIATSTTGGDATERIVEELVELFVLLMTFTGFMEFEDERDLGGLRKGGFL